MPASITLTVSSLPVSTSFFLSALQPLAYVYRGRVGNTIGFGLPDAAPDFWISQEEPGVPSGAAHVAFPAGSQKKVQDFFVAALKAGGKVHGEPQLRDPQSGYYSAAVIDFDGNSIEAVHRPDLILDSSDESRPSSATSANSNPAKPMSQAAPTMVSKAPTTRGSPTEVKSVAPSVAKTSASKSPTQVSKAPIQASRSPTQVSKAPSQAASRAPTAAPTQVSRAPTAAPSQASRAPSYVPSQVPSQAPPPPGAPMQTVVTTAPNGEVVTNFVAEARGMISGARELVNQVRPALDSSNSTPNLHNQRSGSPQSHEPSDTIVGTLLGVAAGAALGYAYHKATKDSPSAERPYPVSRTRTDPNLTNEQYLYYEQQYQAPYAIESPPSQYSRAPSGVGSQRYITMEDVESVAPSTVMRPRRRSSFSGVAPSKASTSKSGMRMLEAPPTAYKAPTAISRATSHQSSRRSSRHLSDEDLRSTARSHASRRTSGTKSHTTSRAPSPHGSERTVVPASKGRTSSGSKASKSHRSSTSKSPEFYPLPPSRAGTWAPGSSEAGGTSFFSSNSKAPKTVMGKSKESKSGRSELTKSVVGKLDETDRLNLTDKPVAPSDSVSQVSSNRGSGGSSGKSRKSRR